MMDGVEMINVFIKVMNQYIYLILNKCQHFDYEKVGQLVELIGDKIKQQQAHCADAEDMNVAVGAVENANDGADSARLQEIKQFFRLTCQYVNDLKNSNDEQIAPSFAKIDL
eukprot:UN03563